MPQDVPQQHPLDPADAMRPGAPTTHPDFDALVRTIWRLRQPDGCPWDREQTHVSIAKNMIEEAYEAVDAIEGTSCRHLREELGDVLMQVVLQSQIAADDGEFDIDAVCRDINEKLVRRHPHVFGDADAPHAATSDDVLGIWEKVKLGEHKKSEEEAAAEGLAPESLLDSVPVQLPALMQAQKISKRAAKAGFEWADLAGVWDKVAEERAEFEAEEPGTAASQEEFGDLLFALVNVARWSGVDAEEALAASNRKFRRRWARMEELARAQGRAVEDLSTVELNELWDRAKGEEKPAE